MDKIDSILSALYRKKNNFSFLAIGLFFTLTCNGQISELIKGNIKVDSIMEASVHIINITQQTGTVNSASGSFEIRVNENDTLWFTSLQYEKKEMIISSKIFQQKFIEIELKEAINKLDVVNISNISLTGNPETDIAKMPVFNKFNLGVPLSTKPLPTPEERRLYSASNSGPLGLLIYTLNGEIERLKKEKKISELLRLVYKAEGLIKETYFLEELGMKENEVSEFIYYCAEKDDLKTMVNGENVLVLMEYFKTMLPTYREFQKE